MRTQQAFATQVDSVLSAEGGALRAQGTTYHPDDTASTFDNDTVLHGITRPVWGPVPSQRVG